MFVDVLQGWCLRPLRAPYAAWADGIHDYRCPGVSRSGLKERLPISSQFLCPPRHPCAPQLPCPLQRPYCPQHPCSPQRSSPPQHPCSPKPPLSVPRSPDQPRTPQPHPQAPQASSSKTPTAQHSAAPHPRHTAGRCYTTPSHSSHQALSHSRTRGYETHELRDPLRGNRKPALHGGAPDNLVFERRPDDPDGQVHPGGVDGGHKAGEERVPVPPRREFPLAHVLSGLGGIYSLISSKDASGDEVERPLVP